ncbi:MAG: flavin reductase [Bacteroidales bacterium]|nr:flavin reductase [Bacteroidales bacterium]
MNGFKSITPFDITDNVFKLLDRDWMLVTAGSPDQCNTMTASWGHLGILWNLPIAIAYIRPQRYTYRFANENRDYTLCFFENKYREILEFCGTKSGRTHDKIKETGLHPLETDRGNVIFKEASLVLECEKIYVDNLKKENFLVPDIAEKNYPFDDFHRFYMGRICNVWIKTR